MGKKPGISFRYFPGFPPRWNSKTAALKDFVLKNPSHPLYMKMGPSSVMYCKEGVVRHYHRAMYGISEQAPGYHSRRLPGT
jgi:hypothetical protein